MDEALHHHDVIARKGQTLVGTLEAEEYSLVVDHSAADDWYFLSLAGLEKGGGSGGGPRGAGKVWRMQLI